MESKSESDDPSENERELEPEEVEFTQKLHEIYVREKKMGYAESVREYRQLEAEFVDRAAHHTWKITETRRRIAEQLLSQALRSAQPHETCRVLWEELVECGFSDHTHRRIYSGTYARCCQQNAEFSAGIAVLEPLIEEMARAIELLTLSPRENQWYVEDIAMLRRIRDELKAGIRG
jgi:hypothetical protein